MKSENVIFTSNYESNKIKVYTEEIRFSSRSEMTVKFLVSLDDECKIPISINIIPKYPTLDEAVEDARRWLKKCLDKASERLGSDKES